jgi:hypothetical protein
LAGWREKGRNKIGGEIMNLPLVPLNDLDLPTFHGHSFRIMFLKLACGGILLKKILIFLLG